MLTDKFIGAFDRTLRTVAGVSTAYRPNPADGISSGKMDEAERRHSAGLMRINHVGEVCAQALYEAQSRFAQSEAARTQFRQAGQEEIDHLAWTAERLQELGSRPSLLNPFWYAGAYALGVMAAKLGDASSLGFVVETERQVEAHLNSHLEMLPEQDLRSRAIVSQMRDDEIEHADVALGMGAAEVPAPAKLAMKAMAKVMTTTAYYI